MESHERFSGLDWRSLDIFRYFCGSRRSSQIPHEYLHNMRSIGWYFGVYDKYHLGSTNWSIHNEPSSWEWFAGNAVTAPTVVPRVASITEVFVRKNAFELYQITWGLITWRSSWNRLGGNWTIFTPTVVSCDEDRIDVFTWGTDNSLPHKRYDGTKGVWTPSNGFEALGNPLAGPPKGASDAVGNLHIVSFSRRGNVEHISFN